MSVPEGMEAYYAIKGKAAKKFGFNIWDHTVRIKKWGMHLYATDGGVCRLTFLSISTCLHPPSYSPRGRRDNIYISFGLRESPDPTWHMYMITHKPFKLLKIVIKNIFFASAEQALVTCMIGFALVLTSFMFIFFIIQFIIAVWMLKGTF